MSFRSKSKSTFKKDHFIVVVSESREMRDYATGFLCGYYNSLRGRFETHFTVGTDASGNTCLSNDGEAHSKALWSESLPTMLAAAGDAIESYIVRKRKNYMDHGYVDTSKLIFIIVNEHNPYSANQRSKTAKPFRFGDGAAFAGGKIVSAFDNQTKRWDNPEVQELFEKVRKQQDEIEKSYTKREADRWAGRPTNESSDKEKSSNKIISETELAGFFIFVQYIKDHFRDYLAAICDKKEIEELEKRVGDIDNMSLEEKLDFLEKYNKNHSSNDIDKITKKIVKEKESEESDPELDGIKEE